MAAREVHIESRPSGSHVVSVRLPAPLAERLLAEASARKMRPSEVVRQAVEAFLAGQGSVLALSATCSERMRVAPLAGQYETVNANMVTGPVLIEVT
jgi:predicted transcriptional regulator